ncbi:MAG: peptidoglycan DD-metalloendopeptidase family protein [Rikenellaceae bacterium]|nr:peptidoglycan DD-metalloendopeptidase family protein [Rikenellaceae bacterium]
MYLRKISLVFIFLLTVFLSPAQRNTINKLKDLPKIPVDTIATSDPDTKIILFTNNTWAYYRPTMDAYNELPVYASYWDNSQIFSYKSVELKDLPEVIDICLINSPSEFHVPYQGRVTSKYGIRKRRSHNGVDIPLKVGEPIYAAFEGKVRYAKFNTGGYGNLVIVRHKNGLETWYAHLSKTNVEENEYVKAGQVLGFGGSTGRSTGPHLHFEVRYNDQVFDPEFLMDFENGRLKFETFALERSYFNINSRASELLLEDDDEDWNFQDLMNPDLQLLAELGDSTAIALIASEEFAKKQAQIKAQEEAKKAVYHTVKKGDVLGKISRNYGVSVAEICRLNNIKSTTTLQIGKKLRIR